MARAVGERTGIPHGTRHNDHAASRVCARRAGECGNVVKQFDGLDREVAGTVPAIAKLAPCRRCRVRPGRLKRCHPSWLRLVLTVDGCRQRDSVSTVSPARIIDLAGLHEAGMRWFAQTGMRILVMVWLAAARTVHGEWVTAAPARTLHCRCGSPHLEGPAWPAGGGRCSWCGAGWRCPGMGLKRRWWTRRRGRAGARSSGSVATAMTQSCRRAHSPNGHWWWHGVCGGRAARLAGSGLNVKPSCRPAGQPMTMVVAGWPPETVGGGMRRGCAAARDTGPRSMHADPQVMGVAAAT